MFFFLSKTLNYLVMPMTIIGALFLVAAFVPHMKWKRRAFVAGLILLLFFSNDFIANEAMHAWEIETVAFSQMKPHDLGIVLTGATVPHSQPADRVYFGRGADRVTHTVQLYKLGLLKKILISGGTGSLSGNTDPEADKFKSAMIMMGVDSTDIMIENETRNTYESAIAVKPMLDSMHYKAEDCLLITSAFHMRRSLACYHKAGVDLQPFTTDFYSHPRKFTPDVLFVPRLEAIALWQKLIKEWVGMLAYKLAGHI